MQYQQRKQKTVEVLTSLRGMPHDYLPYWFLHFTAIFRYTSVDDGQCTGKVRSVEARLLDWHKGTDRELINFVLSTATTNCLEITVSTNCILIHSYSRR